MVPSEMKLRPGLAVQAMVLDTLRGRTPLYRVEQFLASQDVELLLGEPVAAHLFNDTNLARSLDAIFEAGPSKIVTELLCVDRGVPIFGRTLNGNSSDKTSNNEILTRIGSVRGCRQTTPNAHG